MNKLFKPTIRRPSRIALRIGREERNRIDSFCQFNNMTLSDFVRQCIAIAEPSVVSENHMERR